MLSSVRADVKGTSIPNPRDLRVEQTEKPQLSNRPRAEQYRKAVIRYQKIPEKTDEAGLYPRRRTYADKRRNAVIAKSMK